MSLRNRTITVTRKTGAWVDGVWTTTGTSSFDVTCSVQPASGQDLQTLPEGRRLLQTYKIFTDVEHMTVLEQKNNPDIVQIDGEPYEIVSAQAWQNAIIPHFASLAQRLQP
jgi:hypothetical protein